VNKEQNITFITHTILLKSLPETMLFGSRGNVNVGSCEICLTESGDTTLRSQTLSYSLWAKQIWTYTWCDHFKYVVYWGCPL